MKALIRFSVRHPVSVLSALTALSLLGLLCAFILPVDFLPVMSSRNLLVAAEYPGVSAAEMRSMVSIVLEDTFASLRGLKSSSSVSRDGLSLLSLELHWGSDIELALTESRELIDICYESLPSGCMKPRVFRNDSARTDDITLILIPLDGDLRYGRHIAETDIKPRLQRLSGTAGVSVSGGEEEEIQLRFHRAALEARGLSLSDAAEIVAAANFEYPAGTIREGEKELGVKTAGLWKTQEEIGDTPLIYNEGGLVRAGDLADLVRTNRRREAFFLYKGMEAVRIGIRKKAGASPLPLSAGVKREIGILKNLYGKWYDFEISFNTADSVSESLLSLLFSALASVLAAGAVVYLFFRSLRLSLVITGIIPLSALFAFFVLKLCGQSLNVMSLSGVSTGIGMVIDAGAVTAESIQRELGRKTAGPLETLIARGAEATILSNSASSFSTAIVFTPVFFIGGLLGELFTGMAIGLIASISCSCLLSFTYIPALSVFLPGPAGNRPAGNSRIALAAEKYEKLLLRLLKKPRYALIPLALCLLAGALSFFFIERRLLPELSSKTLSWEMDFPPGTNLEAMRRSAVGIYRELRKETWIRTLEISGGLEHDDYQSLALLDEGFEKLRITAKLGIDAEKGREKIAALFAGGSYRISFGKSRDLLSRLLDLKGDLTILRAGSPEEARTQAEALGGGLGFAPDALRSGPVFSPDRLALSRFSVSARYAASAARDSLEGIYASSYYEEGREIPLLVKLRDQDMGSLEDLQNILIPGTAEEGALPLRFLGSFTEEKNEKVLFRYNRRDAKEIRGAPLKGEGLDLVSPGRADIDEMTKNGLFLLIVTGVLLYLGMGAQFESLSVPLLLLSAIPPACSGAFISLLLTRHSLDSNSVIALITLFGISINNSILLYESCAAQDPGKDPGADSRKGSGEGSGKGADSGGIAGNCAKKLRAILITNLTTLIALLPFAADPLGINAQASLAVALIGGLSCSLVMVLTVVPVCLASALPGGRE
ncbi:MAG: efflux RND transporter permease subunit [Treponema sp.]|jgi:multidrug efflux pump subunit AcrB|nr:efflux RND transporter permease subunit [Treponema sp.]